MGPYSRARWVHMLAARQRRVRTYLARRRALAMAAALRPGMLSISTRADWQCTCRSTCRIYRLRDRLRPKEAVHLTRLDALAVQLAALIASVIASDPSLAGNARARSASTLRLYSSLRTRMPPMWGTVANSSVDTSAAS